MLDQWFIHNRVAAWAGVVIGVLLLALCAPAAWTVLTDGNPEIRGWENGWPISGCTIGVVLLGLAGQGLWLGGKPPKAKGPGAP